MSAHTGRQRATAAKKPVTVSATGDMAMTKPTRPAREHAGWIICHEDVDATETLKRLEGFNPSGTAISGKNEHVDKALSRSSVKDAHVECCR